MTRRARLTFGFGHPDPMPTAAATRHNAFRAQADLLLWKIENDKSPAECLEAADRALRELRGLHEELWESVAESRA